MNALTKRFIHLRRRQPETRLEHNDEVITNESQTRFKPRALLEASLSRPKLWRCQLLPLKSRGLATAYRNFGWTGRTGCKSHKSPSWL